MERLIPNKFLEHQSKIRKDLKKQYGLHKGDKEKFYKITSDLMKKIDKSIKNNNYMSYVTRDDESEKKFDGNNFKKKGMNRLASSDKYLMERNEEKNKLIETVFLMK